MVFFLAAATPKQIRELMKVDGLTNDEVKSHLQVCICDYPSVLNHNLVDVDKILHIHDRNWKPFCMLLVKNFFTHVIILVKYFFKHMFPY